MKTKVETAVRRVQRAVKLFKQSCRNYGHGVDEMGPASIAFQLACDASLGHKNRVPGRPEFWMLGGQPDDQAAADRVASLSNALCEKIEAVRTEEGRDTHLEIREALAAIIVDHLGKGW
jgi:hypothetical protein